METLKQYTVKKVFAANKIYGDITIKPSGIVPVKPTKSYVKRYKVGDVVSVKPVTKWDGEQYEFIVGTDLDHDPDSLYTIQQPKTDYLDEVIASKSITEPTSSNTTITTDKFFLGMTKKKTVIVGVALVVLVGAYIYRDNIFKLLGLK